MIGEVTQQPRATESGDSNTSEELPMPVYDQLRRLAAHRLASEHHQHTLQPTALVHEAWLKMSGPELRKWNGRGHFFAAAAEAIRRILVDHARRRLAAKRGGGAVPVDVDEVEIPSPRADDDHVLAVHEALESSPPSIRARRNG
jgi:RNA polymerase sigma factor (TIGR02999 family)